MTIISCRVPFPLALPLRVDFNLNYEGAVNAPSRQWVNPGNLVVRPEDPADRPEYAFVGWYRESDGVNEWIFTSDTVTTNLVLYARWIVAQPSPGQVYSLEFGHTPGALDYCNPMTLSAGFGNGVLFSIWTRIPELLTPPSTQTLLRGNMEVFYLDGANWHLICLVGNIYGYPDGYALYNANYMLSADGGGGNGDYCTYQTRERDKLPLSTFEDWVWVAWQVVINPDKTMTLRQWLKFGMSGAVFPAGNYYLPDGVWAPLDPEGEETAIIEGWDPALPALFRIGTDNTDSGYNSGSGSYLTHARLEARSSRPGIAELEAIARLNAPDADAWGDWELNWNTGAPNLADRSGRGHSLSLQTGGTLYQGPLSPTF